MSVVRQLCGPINESMLIFEENLDIMAGVLTKCQSGSRRSEHVRFAKQQPHEAVELLRTIRTPSHVLVDEEFSLLCLVEEAQKAQRERGEFCN